MVYIEKLQRLNGRFTYRARIRQKGTPDKSVCFPTRKEATEWGKRMESEIRAGRYFGREEDKEKTFSQFIDRYITNELPKNPKNSKKQKLLLSWWKDKLGKYFLCHITPAMIAECRDKLMAEKTPKGTLRLPSTANRYLAALSRAFTICQREWLWIKENPVLKITRPKEAKGKERYLSKSEISLLLSICKKSKSPHLYVVTIFALATGARKGEIVNLKWRDIDFNRRTATFKDTKNGETRTIHLAESVITCLKNEQKMRAIYSEYVFSSRDGKKPADIRESWESALEEAGLDDVCFHTLRHTAASHLAMSGCSTLEIAAVLGHKTLAMVKRYSHLSTSATAEALDKLNYEILGDVFSVQSA